MVCDKHFSLLKRYNFLFSSRIQNGLHHTRGLIFLDFMQFLENQKKQKKNYFKKKMKCDKNYKKSYFYSQHNI